MFTYIQYLCVYLHICMNLIFGSRVTFEICVSLTTIIGFFLLSDLLWQRNRLYYMEGELYWTRARFLEMGNLSRDSDPIYYKSWCMWWRGQKTFLASIIIPNFDSGLREEAKAHPPVPTWTSSRCWPQTFERPGWVCSLLPWIQPHPF